MKLVINGISIDNCIVTDFTLDWEPKELFRGESMTGKLHLEYTTIKSKFGDYETVGFKKRFEFEIFGLDLELYNRLKEIDGKNQVRLEIYRELYTEIYEGNIDLFFFKHDNHVYLDAVKVRFDVIGDVTAKGESVWFIGDFISPSNKANDNLFFYGDAPTPAVVGNDNLFFYGDVPTPAVVGNDNLFFDGEEM